MSVWKPLSMVLVISFKVVMSWDSQDLPGWNHVVVHLVYLVILSERRDESELNVL